MIVIQGFGNITAECPESSDPFYIVLLLYKMGHYFLDTQYNTHNKIFFLQKKVILLYLFLV